MSNSHHDTDISKLSDDQIKRCFLAAKEGRKYEIDKFWQRSLFFWGFIAAAFIAYSKASGETEKLLIACFGLVCSTAWTLSNRGSKYWQESWEIKVERFEKHYLGVELYTKHEERQKKGPWGAHLFSVSKLAVLLSDFSSLTWLALAIRASGLLKNHGFCPIHWPLILLMGTFLYLLLLLIAGRKSS